MAELIPGSFNQTATLWDFNALDRSGEPSFSSASPRTISVRWEDRTVLFINADGEEERSRAVIFLAEDVTINDWLYLGTSAEENPWDRPGAFKVKEFKKTPDLAGLTFERRALI